MSKICFSFACRIRCKLGFCLKLLVFFFVDFEGRILCTRDLSISFVNSPNFLCVLLMLDIWFCRGAKHVYGLSKA